MNIKDNIKSIIALEGMTLTAVAREMAKRTGKDYSVSNLSQKMARNTIKFSEIDLIMDILGYKIKFEK